MIERIPIHETEVRFCDRCGASIAESTNWIRVGSRIIALNEQFLTSGGQSKPILLCKCCSLDFVDFWFWKKGDNNGH